MKRQMQHPAGQHLPMGQALCAVIAPVPQAGCTTSKCSEFPLLWLPTLLSMVTALPS